MVEEESAEEGQTGSEERVMPHVHGQDPRDCGKTGGDTKESIFCMHPEDTERFR